MMSLHRPWLSARNYCRHYGRQALLARAGRRRFSTSQRTGCISALGNVSALKDILRISEEVTDALATNKPVVALETTIYTHGALGNDLDLEGIVRRNGGVPAVVGILGGVPTVGLLPEEVARMVEGSPKKASRRDLAYIVGMGMAGKKIHGGTTVAGTMVLARLAGIRVFGSGGLGGVHRGGHDSLDISADLTELGRTRMAVICSGCKGFLDIPRTLEYLETQGVLVSTFVDGRTGAVDFPAFWARDSGIKSPSVVQDEEQAAAMILAQERLGIESGILFANPIPEEYSISRSEMDGVIEQAVRESTEQGARGSDNTPFILKRIRQLTDGRSVPANKALVQANVERATKIAVALSQLTAGGSAASQADILVAGSVAVDLSCDYAGEDSLEHPTPHLHTSNPAHIGQSVGGVGHNVALAAHKIMQGSKVRLCSLIGDDLAGSTILSSLRASGMDTSCIHQLSRQQYPANRTAQYVAVNDANKNLVLAMADMGIFTAHSFPQHWRSTVRGSRPKWLVVDANWTDRDIRAWIQAGKRNQARVVFEPVSKEKSSRLFCTEKDVERLGVFPHSSVDLATPNHYELAAMHAAAQRHEYLDDSRWWEVIDALGMRGARDRFVQLTSASMTDAGIPQQAVQLLPYIPTIVTKVGSGGSLLTMALARDHPRLASAAHDRFILSRCPSGSSDIGGVYMRMFPAAEQVDDVVSVNGVGDTFLGVLVAGLAQGGRVEDLVDIAQKAAVLTLRSPQSRYFWMFFGMSLPTGGRPAGYTPPPLHHFINNDLLRETAPFDYKKAFFANRAMPPNRPEGDNDSVSSSAQDELEFASDEGASHTYQAQTIDKDSDEEELERFVLGDAASFRHNLFRDESKAGGAGLAPRTDREGGEDEPESDLEAVDDADLFAFDLQGAASKGYEESAVVSAAKSREIAEKDKPAWEDSDDERLTVSLASLSQLRRLRVSEADDVVNGAEYTRRLRQEYLRLNPYPGWAREADERPAKRRRRSSATTSDSEVSSEEASDDDHIEVSALPLDALLRDAKRLQSRKTGKTKKLRPEVIDIQRSRDIPDTHKAAVTSLAFHPKYPVLLSTSVSSVLYLHHIDPTAHPRPNPLLTSVQVKQVPIQRAEFLRPVGDMIFFAGRRRYIHSWDLATGTVQKTHRIQGHQLEQKTWEHFKLSPCGKYLGLVASTRKGGGIINILSADTMQWIAAARLDSRGGIADFCWWSNGRGLTILGQNGQVGEWNMETRRFLAIWNDEGSNSGTVIALGGLDGPVLLGNDRWVAIGSSSGVANIYDRNALILPSEDDEIKIEERPTPIRRLMQLTTAVTVLTFSPDGQLLAFGSKHKKDALKLAHLPSCTVYRNWPTEQTPLGRISEVAFGRKSDLLAIGNDSGTIRLWEIRH
ncbi:Indigoidine synthase A like protein-domain-containing protein [Durotheca rogersii]|uniref:Indigoidine synthase A like protein-domain-containing protein n=1 Tax=Durotheca rogersii TaxID=419775 RepID=UPI00221F9FD1|nr:Indigoidine synthase A like protein-domain-containing protein [Durotheca rogersii]KAI5866900.1 Indigoidine synthase A like protein-domain-containing protein [Durotheca rogersii]